MAASYDTGVVLIFDLTPILSTNGSSAGSHNNYLQHKFTGHGGHPCQGIAFSPVNQLLLCSAGFNNKIHFYDIQEGREVKTIDAKAPLTAIAFCSDGHTVAIGTVTGKILLFDLKDAKQPKMELKGHESKKIRCL
jgi:WD40 repeat protein